MQGLTEIRRHLTRREMLATYRFVAVTLTLAILVCVALAGILNEQVRFEERASAEQVLAENQARVRTFEQYVLRTLDLAVWTARNAELQGSGSNPEWDGSSGHGENSTFTAVLVLKGDSVQSNRTRVSLLPKERQALRQMSRNSPYPFWVSAPLKLASFASPQVAVLNRTNDGGDIAVILIEPKSFTQFADQIPFERDDLISLIGLDGITRARRTGDKLSGGESVAGLVMDRQLASPNGSYLGPSVLDKRVRYFSHRRLAEYGLFVTSGRPLSAVFERTEHRRRSLLIIFLIAVSVVWILVIAAVAARITRAKRLAQLVVSNERLSEAQEIGKIGDWDYDHVNDQLFWSDQLVAMYGRDVGSNRTSLQDVRRYLKTSDISMVESGIARVIEEGTTATWEVDVILENGAESTRRVNAAPIRDFSGKIVGVHGTDQDITAQAKVRELEIRVAELARLDSMNALTATLAHELNQPLGVATNFLAAALAAPLIRKDPTLLGYLAAADQQLDHLAQIVASARDLVVHAGTSMAEVDLETAISATITLLKSATGRRHAKFVSAIEKRLPNVMANEAQIRQVLYNLGKNALDAVPPDRRPEIKFRALKSGDNLQIEVHDNGNGFCDLKSDPFAALSTTKEQGLGLGLSIARTIVEAHGGKIWIERTSVNGTIVALTLELAEG